jgi:prephenate dehydrogenase
MNKPYYEQIAIIGTGMMGTSLGLAIKKAGLCNKIIGIDRNFDNLKIARNLSAIDSYTDCLKDGIADAVLIIFAIPILSIYEVAKRIVYAVRKDAIITDIGSTKGELTYKMTELFYGHSNYVGSHPITGTEKSGAINAVHDLYNGKKCILTPIDKTEQFAVDAIRMFWESIGSDITIMDPYEHDRIMAMVSHLPHFVAYSLVGSIIEREKAGDNLLTYAGGGLKDYTRIASSDPVMWKDIFLSNSKEILAAIDQFTKTMMRLKQLIKEKDGKGIHNFLEQVREVRRQIVDK